jgi:hypothetical protein
MLRAKLYELAERSAKNNKLSKEDSIEIYDSADIIPFSYLAESSAQEEEMSSLATQLAEQGWLVARFDWRWPRDKLVIIDGNIYLDPPERDGGAILYSPRDNFAVISNTLPTPALEELRHALFGKTKAYLVPPGFFRIHMDGKGDILMHIRHIDLSLAILQEAKVLLVDPYYYRQFKAEVDKIKKGENYKVVKVDKKEAYLHPTNCLTLPDGTIIMERAPATISAIERAAPGKKLKIIQVNKSLLASLLRYGSIRCSSNYFYPVVEDLIGLDFGFNKDEVATLIAFLESHREEISISSGKVVISDKGQEILARDLLLRLAKREWGEAIAYEKIIAIADNFLPICLKPIFIPPEERLLGRMGTTDPSMSSV